MIETPSSPYRIEGDEPLDVTQLPTTPGEDTPTGKKAKKALAKQVERLSELQRILAAHDHHALLLVFQAMDAAGKDSTIRNVLSGVNPAGCEVYSFKQPSAEEIDHDFLWRQAIRVPERGRIGVFNRSHYEEVLVVRVHPEYLGGQRLPSDCVDTDTIWQQRFESIRGFEKHLARNGTVVLKFFLNVSEEEQRRRFLARLDEPHKNWKFSLGDVAERRLWPRYMAAYSEALAATSRPWAPWYAIPADDKPAMRFLVAELVVRALESLDLRWPSVEDKDRLRFDEARRKLEER